MSAPVQRSPGIDRGDGARLLVDLATPVFTDRVLSGVERIRRTAVGRAVFCRLRDLGRTVIIERPNPPTDPPNAWTLERDSGGGRAAELVIVYDPVDWPNPAWPGRPPSDDVVLFGRLQDALAIAVGSVNLGASDDPLSSAMEAYLRERTAVPEPPARTVR